MGPLLQLGADETTGTDPKQGVLVLRVARAGAVLGQSVAQGDRSGDRAAMALSSPQSRRAL